MRPQVIFLGAPGSGKGTQASRLVEGLGYSHISTGDLLRKEMAKKSALGNRVSTIINEGKLVDDQTVLDLLKANCDLVKNQYIFDGFPRNEEQAKMLDGQILGNHKSKVFYFDIDLGDLAERLINRRTCKDCGQIYNMLSRPPKSAGVCDVCGGKNLIQRRDDDAATVKNRLKVFEDTIGPMLSYYKKKGNLVTLDATKDVEQLYGALKNNL